MRMSTLPAAILTIAGLALAGAGSFVGEAPSFEDVDVNQDGLISKSEATVVAGLDFVAADQNGDGVLNRSEYMAAVS